MYEWLVEARRVNHYTGRLASNVPLNTTPGGFRPTYDEAVTAAVDTGWAYCSSIVWPDDQLVSCVARGSVDSASAPHVIAPVEMIALFSNGSWKREDARGPSDLEH